MKRLGKLSRGLLCVLVIVSACKPRRTTDELESGEKQSSVDANPVDDTEARIDKIKASIDELQDQKKNSNQLSDAERAELEKQLNQAKIDLAEAEAKAVKAKAEADALAKAKADAASTTPPPPAVVLQGPYSIYFPDTNDCIQLFDPNITTDGSRFRGQPCNNSAGQQLLLEIRDQGYYRIIHKMTNKCMILEGNLAADGTAMALRPCKATPENVELWRYVDVSADGAHFKIQNRQSGLCLHIAVGGELQQGNCVNNYTLFMRR